MTLRFVRLLPRNSAIDAFRLNFSPPHSSSSSPLLTSRVVNFHRRGVALVHASSRDSGASLLTGARTRIRARTPNLTALLATMTARQVDDAGVVAPTCATAGGGVDAGSGGPVARVFDSIVKPEADNREYRGLQLANGMKVYIVLLKQLCVISN